MNFQSFLAQVLTTWENIQVKSFILMRRVYYEERERPDGQLYWFQDNRTGCEKQTVYFERIRQLESELITKEQKHLVSALERLKQLKYPRRKPVVLNQNWQRHLKSQPRSRSDKFGEDRTKLNEKSTLSLSVKQMGICVDSNCDGANRRSTTIERRIHPSKNNEKRAWNEQHAQYYHESNGFKTNSSKAPIHDVFLPSLPCIPNVGHKANIEIENKLRILEIANGEFQQCNRLSDGASRSRKRTGNERRCIHDSTNGIVEQYLSNKDDTPIAATLDETPFEKECDESSCDDSSRQRENGKSETQTRDYDESTSAKQPPPTRRNSQRSTSESKVT